MIVPLADGMPGRLGVTVLLVFASLLVVTLRMISRFAARAYLWWDDALIIVSEVAAIGLLVMEGLFAQWGLGYPISEVSANTAKLLETLFAYDLVYVLYICSIKLSVLAFYLRVFPQQGMRRLSKVAMGLVVAWTIADLGQILGTCRSSVGGSIHLHLDIATQDDACRQLLPRHLNICVFNTVSNFFILAMPLPIVWCMNIGRATKIRLSVVFAVGILVSAVSIIHLVYMTKVAFATDLTATSPDAIFWATLEPNLAILCASLPMLRPLYRAARETYYRNTNQRNSHSINNINNNNNNINNNFLDHWNAAVPPMDMDLELATTSTRTTTTTTRKKRSVWGSVDQSTLCAACEEEDDGSYIEIASLKAGRDSRDSSCKQQPEEEEEDAPSTPLPFSPV